MFKRTQDALDYGGGSLVLFAATETTGSHPFRLTAQRFDSSGAPRSAPVTVASGSGAPAFFVGGVSLSGHSLVLWDGTVSGLAAGHIAARWFDRVGTPLTPVFDGGTAASPATLVLRPLPGLSLVLQDGGNWVRHYPDGQPKFNAAPAWLAAKPDTRVEIIRASVQKAVALLPPAGQQLAVCTQTIEIHAAAGNLCGTVSFPVTAGPCFAQSIDVGRDGTVIQQLPQDLESCVDNGHGSQDCSCTHRFWPRLLQ
jgi:hypothetical protein